MLDDELDFRGIPPQPEPDDERLEESAADVASIVSAAAGVGAFGLQASQMWIAHRRQREPPPEPDSAASDEYDPGFSEPASPVLDFTLDDDPSYGRGGQEYYPGFEDLDY